MIKRNPQASNYSTLEYSRMNLLERLNSLRHQRRSTNREQRKQKALNSRIRRKSRELDICEFHINKKERFNEEGEIIKEHLKGC